MDTWHHFWTQFFFRLSDILPWFAAGAAALVAVSLTPLGRALTRYLREARSGFHAAEGPPELAALRGDLAEVLERLDFIERAMIQQRAPALDHPRDPEAPGFVGPESAVIPISTPV